MPTNLFNVPTFFITLRETIECTIILSVLFSFVNRFVSSDNEQLRKYLKKRIWIGIGLGFFVSILVGTTILIIFHAVEKSILDQTSGIWETIFSFLATIFVTIMALSMIRVTKWKTEIEIQLKKIAEDYFINHNRRNQLPLSLLPFTIVSREFLEAFILIAGIRVNSPSYSLPIPIVIGLFLGILIGYLIYRGFESVSLYIFFRATTILLFFMGAGFLSEAFHELNEVVGYKDIILWKLNCCDPKLNDGWNFAKTIFGWRNVATLASTIGYFLYWMIVIISILIIYIREKYNNNNNTRQQSENNSSTRETQERSSPQE